MWYNSSCFSTRPSKQTCGLAPRKQKRTGQPTKPTYVTHFTGKGYCSIHLLTRVALRDSIVVRYTHPTPLCCIISETNRTHRQDLRIENLAKTQFHESYNLQAGLDLKHSFQRPAVVKEQAPPYALLQRVKLHNIF